MELILDRFSELQEFTEASEDYDFLHCILLDYHLHSLLRVSFSLENNCCDWTFIVCVKFSFAVNLLVLM